ncbi:MAG: hypothetical protein EB168_11920, partial [Euryarchaeota archaeon]|nr:hypothetical protein [Euryarchaeota archaeon]
WLDLFRRLTPESYDYMAASLVDFGDCRHYWPHWSRFEAPVPQDSFVRAHNALMYLSRRAAHHLGEYTGSAKHMYKGHYEVLIPTALKQCGHKIRDIGGYSKYTPREDWGQHYRNLVGTGLPCTEHSTFSAFGNFFTAEQEDGLLYHPVKVPKHLEQEYAL